MGVVIPLGYVEDRASGALVVDGGLRFDGSKSQYLSKNIGNITTFTISYWMKRCGFTRDDTFVTESSTGFFYYVNTDGSIRINNNTSNIFISNGLYRDPSSWYHIVINNNGSTFNLYVNGILDKSASISTQLYSGTLLISRDRVSGAANHANFYLSNIYFIDNQALDASYFGYTDALTNTWRPKKLSSSVAFGTNGFYLPFDGSAPIGQDQSGRGNNWTPVNFGGSNTLEKATGALPILNTDGGGKIARVGVRTDSSASSLVLALPLVGIKSDFSNKINSGATEKVITANGAVATNSYSNFYGGSFDCVGDTSTKCLDIADSADFAFASGDALTVEAWIRLNSSYTRGGIFQSSQQKTGGLSDAWFFRVSGSQLNWGMHASSTHSSPNNSVPLDTWTHVAICRNTSNEWSAYINGISQSLSGSVSTTLSKSGTGAMVGQWCEGSGTLRPLNGHIQDFRLYKGLAKYTNNFIPASTDPDILPDTPSGVSYSSNVALVPSTDGAVAFDGTGDYLSLASSADFGFSTPSGNSNDFTIEWFKHWTTLSGYQTVWSNNYISSPGLLIQTGNGDGRYRVYVSSGTEIFQETNAPAVGSWYHYALVRNGTTYTLYRNGIANGAAGSSSAAGSGSDAATIGQGNGSYYENGFISNFHVVKGTALYTSNFTPPSAPISSVANTKLLCCKSNSSATAFDVSPGTITANGDAKATNFNPFTVNINTQRGKQSGWATLNPLSSASNFTISNGNLKSVDASSTTSARQYANTSISSGKYYFETTIETASSTTMTGFAVNTGLTNSYPGSLSTDWTYHSSGLLYNNGSTTSTTAATSAGDVIGNAIDMDTGKIWFSVNGNFVGGGVPSTGTNASFSSVTGTITPVFRPYASTISVNFGQKPFKFPPPAGFQPLALANTPRPTIVRPDQFMGVVTYSGNDGTQSINLGFKPDFVWSKGRNNTSNHLLMDTVRGGNKVLITDVTDSEYTGSYIQSFNTNGYTINSTSSGLNASGYTYVNWAWKAGGNSNTYNINDVGYATASAAGLTAGTITPTGASVNTKSGFSIIKYNSGGSAGNYTISHGLTQTPKFIIHKSLGSSNWWVYHASAIDNLAKYLQLNSTNGVATNQANMWGGQFPDSSVLGVRVGDLIGTSTDAIMYAWAEVPGFSKFGSYTGNGSSDGPFVFTGLRPRFLIYKRTDAADTFGWIMIDSARDTYNVAFRYLGANVSTAEGTTSVVDFLSNGFKLRLPGADGNVSGGTYIYMAFAETPTQNLYGAQSNAR
jgi:hypothetical protein